MSNNIMMKKFFLFACVLSLSLSVMADDKKVNAAELTKITFDGDKVVLHYTNGTTEQVEELETLTIDLSEATSINERTAISEKAGLEGQQVYSLDGRNLGKSAARLEKGVYIIGNKKVVVK
jgi:hypothetical protein